LVGLGLNSGFSTCKTSTLLLETHLWSILLWLLFLEMESHELFAQKALVSQVTRIIGVSHQHPALFQFKKK
jgi:hypothetical protein